VDPPAIGDLPLANVDNLSVKPLIDEMCKSKLSPRTVNKYVEHIKQVVESLRGPNGEPIHKRKWDPETMDLPIVEQLGAEPSIAESRPNLRTHSGKYRSRAGTVCSARRHRNENL
jgi:hypothetical protein